MRLGAHPCCRVFNLRHFGGFFFRKSKPSRSLIFLKESQEHVEKDLVWKELCLEQSNLFFFRMEHEFFYAIQAIGVEVAGEDIPSPKTNSSPLKVRNLETPKGKEGVLQPSIFGCYVSFREVYTPGNLNMDTTKWWLLYNIVILGIWL